jgi:hypothetical protein
LAEQGFVYRVNLRDSIEPHTLDDLNNWLKERGLHPKQDYIMSNWGYYFKEKDMSLTEKDKRGSTPLHWACF